MGLEPRSGRHVEQRHFLPSTCKSLTAIAMHRHRRIHNDSVMEQPDRMRLPTVSYVKDKQPEQSFTIEVTIGIEDRIAGWFFTYKDLYAARRRRILYILLWLILVFTLLAGFSSWQKMDGGGIGAFSRQFKSGVFGLEFGPMFFVILPLLIYYLRLPAMIRRQLRQWYKAEHFDPAQNLVLRFEPGGLVANVHAQRAAISCRRLADLVDTPGYRIIRLMDVDDVYVLPLGQITPDQIEKLDQWAATCRADASGAQTQFTPAELADEPEAILGMRFIRSATDRAALLAYQMERPVVRRQRRLGLIILLIAGLFIPIIAVIVAWFLDPSRVPVRYAAPLLLEMFFTDLWKWTLGLWAIIVAGALVHPRLRRAHARQLGAELHARIRTYEQEVRLHDEAVVVVEDGLYLRFEWVTFREYERVGDYAFLLRKDADIIQIPFSALNAEQQTLFEHTVKAHIGKLHNEQETP